MSVTAKEVKKKLKWHGKREKTGEDGISIGHIIQEGDIATV